MVSCSTSETLVPLNMFAGIHCRQIQEGVSLVAFAYGFSPFVEEVDTSTVVIDVEGCELLFGSAYQLVNEISRRGTAICKSINVALTTNPDAAIHAAKFCTGVTFTAAGEELNTIGSLPISNLQFDLVGIEEDRAQEIFETLKLWGVHTLAQFAELPVNGISQRLGQDGLKLKELAAGKTDRHLKLQPAPSVFHNSIELEYPIAELEPLSFVLARLLNEICASLNADALATNSIQVELKLENAKSHELNLNLPYAMRDHKVFLKLLLLETEAHPPPSSVMAVHIHCEPVKPRLLQTGLFVPLAPEPEKLELTLARLSKLVGAENVGSAELIDTHRPDAFRIKKFVLKDKTKRKGHRAKRNPHSAIRTPHSIMGFRMFRPAIRALVQAQRGRPIEISAWDKTRSVYGKVIAAAGPWRTTGDWWRSDLWARDEWDIAIAAARGQVVYRIYRQMKDGQWFVEGSYD